MQDRLEVLKRLTALSETLGSEMSEAKLFIYEQTLKRFPDEQIFMAISKAAATLRFFPKPVELIELIEGKKEEQSTLAWESLLETMQHVGAYQSVIFEDGRIGKCVRLLGGWEKLCQSETKYLNLLRNDFVKVFNSLDADLDPELTEGIGMKQMASGGYAHLVSPPLRIACPSVRCGTLAISGDREDQKRLERKGTG